MKTTLHTEITVADICKGFVYNEYEGATPHQAWHMYLCDEVAMLPFNRCLGISIRPVTDK